MLERHDIERARSALHAIDPSMGRDDWHRVGRAAIAAGLSIDDLVQWSEPAANYSGERDVRAAFRTVTPEGGTGPGTLFRTARDAGWSDDKDKPQQRPVKAAARPAAPREKPADGMGADEVHARCEPATNGHPYILQKGAASVPLDGLRVVPAGDPLRIAGESMAGALVVPVRRADGTLSSLQFVTSGDTAARLKAQGKPTKLNLPNHRLEGWHVVGDIAAGAPLYVCEGPGQAWACWQATGHAAIVTFGSGRMRAVAAELRERDASARLVLVPDVGKEADAETIARDVRAAVACMPEGEPPNFDANDFALREGHDALRLLLEAAREPERPQAEPTGADAEHPLARIVRPCTELQAPQWLLPGFLAAGLTLIAGGHGVGKTTALLPLAAGVAGIHEPGWPLMPKHWRAVVYVIEDVPQAQRIMHGLAGHLKTTTAALAERVHLVDARRLPAAYLVQVGDNYRARYGRTVDGVELPPLVVLDTQAATIALESENDNSEASAAVAALKQHFAGLPVWLVAHLAKQNLNRSDVQHLTSRGASAWEADANCTAFLVREGEGANATRWLTLGKRRFEPRWPELLLQSHCTDTLGYDAWGAPESLTLRWATAHPPEGTRQELAAKAKEAQALQDEAELRQEIRDTVQIAWQEGHPLNRAGVKAKVRRKVAEVVACIERLMTEGFLVEIHVPRDVRAHPSRADFLVNLDTPEREAMRRGEPLPQDKAAIPESWKKPQAPVPDAEQEIAPQEPFQGLPEGQGHPFPNHPFPKEKHVGTGRNGSERVGTGRNGCPVGSGQSALSGAGNSTPEPPRNWRKPVRRTRRRRGGVLMNPRELLHELRGAGFSVAAEAGRLLVRPASKLSDEQRAAVRDAKAQLLALLAADAAEVARERFEERAGIAQFDGGLSRSDAEALAAADAAYQDHHFDCAQCIAAGRGDSYGSRCDEGAALWRRYEAACDAGRGAP